MKKFSAMLAFGLSLSLVSPVFAEDTTAAPAAEGAAKPAKKAKKAKAEVTPAGDAAKAEAPKADAPKADAAKPEGDAKPAKPAKKAKKAEPKAETK